MRRPGVIIASALVGVVALAVGLGALIGHLSSGRSKEVKTEAASATSPSAPTTTVPPAVGTGWLAQDSTGVYFVQWFANNGTISGTMQVAATGGTGTDHAVTGGTYQVSGTVDGSKVMVSVNGRQPWFGTLTGTVLTLNVPQTDGTLQPVPFRHATVDDYNRLVASLHGVADSQNSSAARLQAQQLVDKDAAAVAADIGRLIRQRDSLPDAVKPVAAALKDVSDALAATKDQRDATVAAARQHPDGDNGSVCTSASATETDASAVDTQSSGVETHASTVESNIRSTRSQIDQTENDYAKLLADLNAVPGYTPLGMLSRSDISTTESQATGAIASAVAATNAVIDQANGMVVTAYQYARDAYQAGACRSSVRNPTPREHIGQ